MNFDWRKTMLSDGARITDAVRVLEESSLRIVLVVDEERRLIGTVTDGDIRRGLIRHLRLDDPVTTVMNNSPVIASSRQSLDTILALMRQWDVLQVPIIDEDGRVSRLEFLQELTDRRILENPVLLMAGGSGQRLRPLTADVPKPMLKVGDKPLLESIIEQLIEAGFCNVYISIHYKGEVVRDYFGDGSSWGISIRYLEESAPLGTGGALGLLPATDSEFPLLVMNGDLLTKVDFGGLLAFHEEQGSDLTVCVREYDLQVPYGVVEVRDQAVCGMIEKPIQKFFVNAGIYVLNHDLVAELEKAAVVDMTDIIDLQITNKKKVNAFPIHEYWLDIGLIKQYEQAPDRYSTDFWVIDHGKLLALIPARGGSERLPGKNLLLLAGKPLIEWSIDASLSSRFIDKVIVSTEDPDIADSAQAAGAEVPFRRPRFLASSSASSMDVVQHALIELEKRGEAFEYVLLLQPTSPLRNSHHIDNAIELMRSKGADAVISVTETEHPVEWTMALPESLSLEGVFGSEFHRRTQDLPVRYMINGAIYLARCCCVKEMKTFFLQKNVFGYIMERSASIDIDTSFDLKVAETLLSCEIGGREDQP